MKTAILDTNLFILFVVGQASFKYISNHKRLNAYTISDYHLLISILSQSNILTTPNILTESSNLLKQIGEPARSTIFWKFSEIVDQIEEAYIESRVGVRQAEFMRLGLTDSVLLLASSNPSMVLVTADLGLYLAAARRGLDAINFNHHR
jgi:hypothetical protein